MKKVYICSPCRGDYENNIQRAKEYSRAAAMKGCIPIAEVSKAVMDVGYDGPACLELFRPEYWEMDAEDVIKMGAECCAPYLK